MTQVREVGAAVADIAKVLGASEFQIVKRLYQLETISMGLNGNRERLKSVAEKLMKLNVSLYFNN